MVQYQEVKGRISFKVRLENYVGILKLRKVMIKKGSYEVIGDL